MSVLCHSIGTAGLFQHSSNTSEEFNFTALDERLHAVHTDICTGCFGDDSDDDFGGSFFGEDDNSSEDTATPSSIIYGCEFSFEASITIDHGASKCLRGMDYFGNVTEKSSPDDTDLSSSHMMINTKYEKSVTTHKLVFGDALKGTGTAGPEVSATPAENSDSERSPSVTAATATTPAVSDTVQPLLGNDLRCTTAGLKRVKLDASGTPLLRDSAPSSIAPTHFAVPGQSKDVLLFLLRDHLDNNSLQHSYCAVESLFSVTVPVHPEAPIGTEPCEFKLRLFATEVCSAVQASTYVVEGSLVHGDMGVFEPAFAAIRSSAIFDSSSEHTVTAQDTEPAAMEGSAAFFSRPENRLALAQHVHIPPLVADATDNTVITGCTSSNEQRRLRAARNLCDVSSDPSMVDTLLELGALPQLLRIFRDSSCASDGQPAAVTGMVGTVGRVDCELMSAAVTALCNLCGSERARVAMAGEKALLTCLAWQVATGSAPSSFNSGGDEDGDNKVDSSLLLSESKSSALPQTVHRAVRHILTTLCKTHPDAVCEHLAVPSVGCVLEMIATSIISPTASATATVAGGAGRKRAASAAKPLLLRPPHLAGQYSDSVGVSSFHTPLFSSSGGGGAAVVAIK